MRVRTKPVGRRVRRVQPPTGRRTSMLVAAAVLAAAFILAAAPAAQASHWALNGWKDEHKNYPAVPYGYKGITYTFGKPCNSAARANRLDWRAADDGKFYKVVYHRKLGPAGGSSNVPDIRGHIGNAHLDKYVKAGIYGYACRYVKGTSKYSVHAWGIAIDQNSKYEHEGHYHVHSVTQAVADIFAKHNWYWGKAFGDAMHFQYARGY